MNSNEHHNIESNLTVFLFGAIFNLFAHVESGSLGDYTVKAFIGGMIWLAFKIAGDLLSEKIKNRKKNTDDK
jgi:hypothetical protein